LDETGAVPALGETSVHDSMAIDNSTSPGHLPSERTLLPSSSLSVRNGDVLDEDYSEISAELAAITAHASEFAKSVKGKCTRPSSRRGQTQTTVHSTVAKLGGTATIGRLKNVHIADANLTVVKNLKRQALVQDLRRCVQPAKRDLRNIKIGNWNLWSRKMLMSI
jgi:hypothetical protein